MADNEAGAADPEQRAMIERIARMQLSDQPMSREPKPRAVVTFSQMGAKCGGGSAKAAAAAESSSDSDSDDSDGINTEICEFLKEQLHPDDDDKHFCANPRCETNQQKKTINGGWCFTCHGAYYCSPRCQGQAWPRHRLECEGREVKGPNIQPDHFPDQVVSDAARVVVSDGTPIAAARERERRRKRLLTAVKTFKAELLHHSLGLHVVKGAEALAKQHESVRLSLHQIAVCLLFLGEARRAKSYLRLAQRDWSSSMSLCPASEFSLYARGWDALPRFARFVARDNNIRMLMKHLCKCEHADVDRRRILGHGIISEMDEKIAAGTRFLHTRDFVVMLYETWLVSLVYEYEYRILRQMHYAANAIAAMGNEPDVMTTAQAVETEFMVKHMKEGSEIRMWRITPADICTGAVVWMCCNPACALDRWGVTSTGTKVCPRCDTARYCSKKCQTDHWPVHKRLCARLVRVGTTVCTPCNDDVREAAAGEDPVGKLALLLPVLRRSIATGKPGVREMYDAREVLECPEESTVEVLRNMRRCVCSVQEWIISATQVLLMQGRTEKAFHQLQDAYEVSNMRLLVPGDTEDVMSAVMASARMDRRIKELGDEVTYYMQEQKLVRLMHERAQSPAGSKNIMLYSSIFDEICSQITFCEQHGQVAREFYARYMLWREARRYSDEYTGQEHKHMYYIEDEQRIKTVLESVDDAHIATQDLCDAYASDMRVERMPAEEREVAFDVRYKQLCMMGTYDVLPGEVSRMKV